MNNTSKIILGSVTVAATALATTGIIMNKDKLTNMAREKLNAMENAKDDIAGGMKAAAKEMKGVMRF